MHFVLVSLLALSFRTLARMRGAHRELALPTSVFWAANIVAAVLFGLGHLPATAAVAPLSAALLVRAVWAAGLVFGELYKRHGLEWAMASHFGVDIVARVALSLFIAVPVLALSAFLWQLHCRQSVSFDPGLPRPQSHPRGLWRDSYDPSRSYAARPTKGMPQMGFFRARANGA